MNCLPSGKLIANKNKNKTLSLASQKYEQRIKAAKTKQSINLITTKNEGNLNVNYDDYVDNWLKKRTDIDNWRRDVISAMQHGNSDNVSSINTYDSCLHPDSSTLTTSSTLLSAGEIYKKSFRQKENPSLLYDPNENKIPKSPSIPIIRSQIIDKRINPKIVHQVIQKNNYMENPNISTDDDEVFSPTNYENNYINLKNNYINFSINRKSSKNYMDFVPNREVFINEHDKKYTPQPVKRPWYLPMENTNLYANLSPIEHQSSNNINNKTKVENFPQNAIPPKVLNGHNVHLQNQYQTGNLKPNLHKNETNVKLILRNSNLSSNNEHVNNQFQRSGSLNIKRYNIHNNSNPNHYIINNQSDKSINKNMNNFSNHSNINEIKINQFIDNNNINNHLEKSISKKRIDYPMTTHVNGIIRNQFIDSSTNRSMSMSHNHSQNKPYGFVLLHPTFSQDNLASQTFRIESNSNPFIKNSSLNNLQDHRDDIPKIPINKPLMMRFVFASEPNLAPNFVHCRPVKIM